MSKKSKQDQIWEGGNTNLTSRKESKEDPVKLAARIEQRVRQRDKLWKELQTNAEAMASTFKLIQSHDLETYQLLTRPDALYGDSPIGPAFNKSYLKQYLIKIDMDFLGGLFLEGKPAIKTLVERGEESSRWIMRFTKEPEKPKTGLEQIVEG